MAHGLAASSPVAVHPSRTRDSSSPAYSFRARPLRQSALPDGSQRRKPSRLSVGSGTGTGTTSDATHPTTDSSEGTDAD